MRNFGVFFGRHVDFKKTSKLIFNCEYDESPKKNNKL